MKPVESGVPMEQNRETYNFGRMAVGDSIFFNGANTTSKQMTAARIYGRYHGWKFSGRSIDGGLRIWRVE